MSVVELRRLWALHEVDDSILKVQARIRGLEDFSAENEAIRDLTERNAPFGGKAAELKQELKDLEAADADLAAKIKRTDALLYGGKVSSSREIEGYEKELAGFKARKSEGEDRMLELMDEVPSLEDKAAPFELELAGLQARIKERTAQAAVEQPELRDQLQKLVAARPAVAKEVPPGLLARYEATRQKRQGVGMALITAAHSCSGCGMKVAEKSVDLVHSGSIVTCESCSRILYITDGVS